MFNNERLVGEFCYIKEELRSLRIYITDIANYLGKPKDISAFYSLSACCYSPKTIVSQLENIENALEKLTAKKKAKRKSRRKKHGKK